jgi:hypothetical protein
MNRFGISRSSLDRAMDAAANDLAAGRPISIDTALDLTSAGIAPALIAEAEANPNFNIFQRNA